MSSKSLEYIQEVGDDEGPVDCNSTCKRISNCITKNKMIGEIDFFSLDVKFLIKGEETFRTIFSGLVSLTVILILGVITYFVAWPDSFASKIIKTEYNTDVNATGLSLFGYSNEPISFSVISQNGVDVPPEFAAKLYYIQSGKEPRELKWDTNCKSGNFCLTPNVNQDIKIQIYGGKTSSINSGKLSLEVYWCSFFAPGCASAVGFNFEFHFVNTKKQRQKSMIPYSQKSTLIYPFGLFFYYLFDYQISREEFTSNNKIQGLISNILPQTFYSYYIQKNPQISSTMSPPPLVSQLPLPQKAIFTASFAYSNKKMKIDQKFVNVITPILFFFSLLDPLNWIVNKILLQRYNRNSRDLYIASKLYYVEDVDNDEKYNFSKGPLVFFMCLIHRHPLTNLFIRVLALCGRNLIDIMPTKCIHIMNMINKGSSLMCQNVFFGGLEELSTLEDCPGKKIPFDNVNLDEQEEEEEEIEANYFPQNPIRRAAFIKFCQDNEYYSAARKNKVYEILLDNKFTTFLKDGFHKQFQTYVRNIQGLKMKGKFLETMDDLNFPVELVEANHDRGDETQSDMKFSKMQTS